MMGWLSKLIVVDKLGCPKCKRNSADFWKKKIYPQIKRIWWNLLTLIESYSQTITISLIHGIYKIIAKILSSRLKQVIGSLISDNQTAFIANRQIVDGFMVANEMVYDLKRSRRSSLIFKVDFQKAFDSVL